LRRIAAGTDSGTVAPQRVNGHHPHRMRSPRRCSSRPG